MACSPGFADYYAAHGVDPEKIEILYNWADIEAIEVARAGPKASGPLRLLYAGNLGYSQGLETLIEAAKVAGSSVEVTIVGAGNAQRSVKAAASEIANVHVLPPVDREAMPGLLAQFDVHVVIQRKLAAGVNLPSKIAPSLASGRPILGSLDANTPAGRLLLESGGAVMVEPESPNELAQGMTRLLDPGLRLELGRRGRRFAEARLSREGALDRMNDILTAI